MINKAKLAAVVQELAGLPGVRGCALVDATACMIWTAHGELADNQSMWEAAADHWRLHERNHEHFRCLGEPGPIVAHHLDSVLAVFRCATDPELLFVAVGVNRVVDWPQLYRMGLRVGRQISGT